MQNILRGFLLFDTYVSILFRTRQDQQGIGDTTEKMSRTRVALSLYLLRCVPPAAPFPFFFLRSVRPRISSAELRVTQSVEVIVYVHLYGRAAESHRADEKNPTDLAFLASRFAPRAIYIWYLAIILGRASSLRRCLRSDRTARRDHSRSIDRFPFCILIDTRRAE